MKYFIRVNELDVITYMGSSRRVPTNCTEITKSKYNEYKSILASVPNKDGYDKVVTLYVDGTYTVEYIKVDVDEE